jgi:hypothetical protein
VERTQRGFDATGGVDNDASATDIGRMYAVVEKYRAVSCLRGWPASQLHFSRYLPGDVAKRRRDGSGRYPSGMSAYRISQKVSDTDLAKAARGLVAFERGRDRLVISWWWRSRLAIVWGLGASAFGYAIARMSGDRFHLDGVLCIVGAAACLYVTLAYVLNRTRIVIDEARIDVSHGPIPWPRGGSVELATVAQLFVKENVYGKSAKSRSVEYRVMVRTLGGEDIVLVNGPIRPRRARAVEALIEAYLSVEDAPVKGEL